MFTSIKVFGLRNDVYKNLMWQTLIFGRSTKWDDDDRRFDEMKPTFKSRLDDPKSVPESGVLGTLAGYKPIPIILTENGYIRQGASTTTVGDLICILLGCDAPMVLRQQDHYYEVVGPAYVPGIMNGGAMKKLEEGTVTLQDFELH
jgi:hypothetical protein